MKKATVSYKDKVLHKVSDEFIKLTGYKLDYIKGKSSSELADLLKINDDNFFKGSSNSYEGYMFTSKDEPKHVEITRENSNVENEIIYYFKENQNEFLEGLLSTCSDDNLDDTESVAIYSYPDLICLKANTNCKREWDLLNPKDSDLVGSVFVPATPIFSIDIKERGYYYSDNFEFTDKKGNTKYWTVKSKLIYQRGGSRFLKTSFIDKTEEVLAKRTAQKQKKEMEIILDSIPDAIIKLNNKGEYEYTNKRCSSKLPSYISNKNPLTNKDFFKHLKYNDIKGHQLKFNQTPDVRVLNGETFNNYVLIVTDDLSTTYFKCSGTPIYDHDGNIEGGVLVYKDIESIIKLEEYDALAKNIKHIDINYATISYNDFKIKYMNEGAFESLKMAHPYVNSLIEVIGDNFFDYYGYNSKSKETVIEGIRSCIEEETFKYIHTQRLIEKGKVEYIKTIFQPIFDENKKVDKITCVGMYITDEILAKKKMIKSLKAQEEIFVNTSHELKTPINLIFSACQLSNVYLKNEAGKYTKQQIKQNNQIIMQNCYRTIKLINNILDVSRIEQGFYELNLENRNVVNVVEDIVASVSNYIKDNKLKIIFDPEVEEKIIALDLYKFERIMLNLISNAIKFSKDKGTIFISLADRGNTVEISVKDQGIGIDKKNIKNIFNKFKQENKSLNRKTEGTGIGLSLVKSIVELHKGSIDLESTVGVGSKFIINIPSKIVDNPVMLQDELIFENRVEMIKFEFSDIYDC